ncbi:MAG: hypothetical protein QXI42_10050 [Thermoproteota archaeon]
MTTTANGLSPIIPKTKTVNMNIVRTAAVYCRPAPTFLKTFFLTVSSPLHE